MSWNFYFFYFASPTSPSECLELVSALVGAFLAEKDGANNWYQLVGGLNAFFGHPIWDYNCDDFFKRLTAVQPDKLVLCICMTFPATKKLLDCGQTVGSKAVNLGSHFSSARLSEMMNSNEKHHFHPLPAGI